MLACIVRAVCSPFSMDSSSRRRLTFLDDHLVVLAHRSDRIVTVSRDPGQRDDLRPEHDVRDHQHARALSAMTDAETGCVDDQSSPTHSPAFDDDDCAKLSAPMLTFNRPKAPG